MTMDGEEKVRVYTRQDPQGWLAAKERGWLTGSHNGSNTDNEDFTYHYEWMRRQMEERIPDFSGDLPVWTWLKRQNERKWVNSWKTHERRNLPIYPRITALVPRKRMLLSCYEMWHLPLNNWFCPQSEEEDQAHEERWTSHYQPGVNAEYQREVEATWPMIFDIHLPRSPYVLENYGGVGVIQACVDRIYLDEVVQVRWAENP